MADPCDLYALQIETADIVVPGAVFVSEDCTIPEQACCNPQTSSGLICVDDVLEAYDGEWCDSGWESSDTTGLGGQIYLEVEIVTLQLPAGTDTIGTACFTIGCDETIDLDCECS